LEELWEKAPQMTELKQQEDQIMGPTEDLNHLMDLNKKLS
jgi:hypothetical protein